MDSAILDPTNRDMMGVIYATEALLGRDDYCMEYISAYREGFRTEKITVINFNIKMRGGSFKWQVFRKFTL